MDNNNKSLNEYKHKMFWALTDKVSDFIVDMIDDKSFPNTNQEKKMKDYVIKHWHGTQYSPSELNDMGEHWDVNKRGDLIWMYFDLFWTEVEHNSRQHFSFKKKQH